MSVPPQALASADTSAAALLDAFNAAFADYVLPLTALDEAGWCRLVQRQGIDLERSHIVRRDGEVAAFALVTPIDGQRSRIAVMGARPSARATGAAPALLHAVLAAARARGERHVELEVFAQNPRALALYRRHGFAPVGVLHGYASRGAAGAAGPFDPVSHDAAVRWLADAEHHRPGRWPWQVGSAALAAAPAPLPTCWRQGHAQLVFHAGDGAAVTVASLIDLDEAQRGAAALLAALQATYPQRALKAPPLQRDAAAARAFDAAGWTREPLHQLWMRAVLVGQSAA